MKVTRHQPVVKASVDFTPMIDVVFQLILFFLVSTTLLQLPGISLKLPQSVTAENAKVESIMITVNAAGEIWLNDEKSDISSLQNMLEGVKLNGVKKEVCPVVLMVDENVVVSTEVSIFDVLRKSGFVNVSIRTSEK